MKEQIVKHFQLIAKATKGNVAVELLDKGDDGEKVLRVLLTTQQEGEKVVDHLFKNGLGSTTHGVAKKKKVQNNGNGNGVVIYVRQDQFDDYAQKTGKRWRFKDIKKKRAAAKKLKAKKSVAKKSQPNVGGPIISKTLQELKDAMPAHYKTIQHRQDYLLRNYLGRWCLSDDKKSAQCAPFCRVMVKLVVILT